MAENIRTNVWYNQGYNRKHHTPRACAAAVGMGMLAAFFSGGDMAQQLQPLQQSEFTVEGVHQYDHRSPARWLLSHVLRYPHFLFSGVGGLILGWLSYTSAQRMIGVVAESFFAPVDAADPLVGLALIVMALLIGDGAFNLVASLSVENISARVEADTREELYRSLLGKNQAFHDRQRAGDIMARATDDTGQIRGMIMPGAMLVFEAFLGLLIPIAFIGSISLEMLVVPLLFVVGYVISIRYYMERLGPIIGRQRGQFGMMNAGLEETVSGIEVVKASAREVFERAKFRNNARRFRDLFVMQGETEARYLPLLFFGIAVGFTFLHAMWAFGQGRLTIGDVIAIMALITILRFPTFISLFSLSLVQSGLSSAERILNIIKAKTDLDENARGHRATVQGAIAFENVSFGYDDGMVLSNISFHIEPGQTIAIVGQTGSGKSALTRLVNRTYDATQGRVLIDGIDVRDWSLGSLRSQISKIEQDVFLFSRSIADNIAFGAPNATREQIEAAARDAQTHDFISAMPNGYETVVGERGVTLSGGQRQRVALARAFLSDPRILILDDSTSAIDSATEDEIQKAIRRARQNRTMLLITHRLSQIRWADLIIVLDKGQVVAQGSHEQLLRTSIHYRRVFARYDTELPPLVESVASAQADRVAA
jgi:ATP-binding cassette, subfamily B, bacterial